MQPRISWSRRWSASSTGWNRSSGNCSPLCERSEPPLEVVRRQAESASNRLP
jgi:hypothetical protein